MTRQRNRRNAINPQQLHKWKVIDHRSGFQYYNDEVVIDSKGVLTHKRDMDPQYPIEADQKLNYVLRPLPYVRHEQKLYTNNNPYVHGALPWEQWNTVTWDQWFTKWDEA